jgi:hypothetical protein
MNKFNIKQKQTKYTVLFNNTANAYPEYSSLIPMYHKNYSIKSLEFYRCNQG